MRERIAAFSGDDPDMLEPLQVLTGLGLGLPLKAPVGAEVRAERGVDHADSCNAAGHTDPL